MKITMKVNPAGHHKLHVYIQFVWTMPWSKEEYQFNSFYHKITSAYGEGHKIYNFLCLYPINVTYQIS